MRAPEPTTTLPSRWLCSNWKGVKSSATETCDHASAEEPSDSTAAISAGVIFLNWGITIVFSRCKYNELRLNFKLAPCAVDFQPPAVTDDLRTAVAEGFYGFVPAHRIRVRPSMSM